MLDKSFSSISVFSSLISRLPECSAGLYVCSLQACVFERKMKIKQERIS